MRHLAILLGLVIFCNLEPGSYRVVCDGQTVQYEVGADGTLGAECQSVSVARITDGANVTCKERAR